MTVTWLTIGLTLTALIIVNEIARTFKEHRRLLKQERQKSDDAAYVAACTRWKLPLRKS